LLPLDGIVRTTAQEATRGAKTDVEKVQKIYDWIVTNTYREPKVRGCGEGDIKTMLETNNLGGKCADLNALFVGLCRAAGVPARDVLWPARSAQRFRLPRAGWQLCRPQRRSALPCRGLPQRLWLE